MSLRERLLGPRAKRRLLVLGAIGLALWVTFLDSHSLLRRMMYARQLDRIEAENAELQADNERLAAQIEDGLDAETVERVAREQYGMRRPGETVYRVVDPD